MTFETLARVVQQPGRAAAKREDQLAATLDHAAVGIAEVDADGRLMRVNAHLGRLMGYSAQELQGRSIFEESHPDDSDADRAQFCRQRAGEIDRYSIEKRIRRKDGGYFWAAVTSSSVRDEGGRFRYAVRVQHDVTEGRQAQESLALQLASIVESSDDAIVSKDLDGIITTWNRGAERLFGYSAEEAIGRPILMLIPPDRVDEEPGILARIRSGERIDHYETVRRRKDGGMIDISLTVSPMRDNQGRIVGASKIARDITERKVAEAKLRQSEHRLRDLLGAIPAAIYTTDAQGRITYYNQAAVDLAGRTPTLGSDEWCVTWKLSRPDGTPLPHDECPMAVALREGRSIRNVEAIAERPDGTRIPFIPYPTLLRDEAGTIVGAINMLVDVSERKQAETQQRVLLDELNHRVKNNLQMLQSLLFTASQRTQSGEARRVLDEASARIAAVAAAQRVLYSTRNATRFSAREFVDAVCDSARQTFPADIEILRDADPAELSNDVAMPLALILNELLTNAVKHGIPAGAPGTIEVRLSRHGDSFVLSVEDDGPGFDPASARGRTSGLQLVQGLARQLRGRFVVTTQPVTRCSLQFPAKDPA
jgi:PAS domain S-box-containing protein